MFAREVFRLLTPGGGRVLAIHVQGGVRVEGSIQTQKYGFTENFAPKNIGIMCQHKSTNVLYNLGQHSLDSKLISFWK